MQLTVRVIEQPNVAVAPTDLTVGIGGIEIGASSNAGASSTHTATVPDGTSVDISITESGYHPYSITIDNVYKADREIVIILVPEITDINDANYQRPQARFFYFQDPCSFNVDVYSASSFTGEITWYFNNQLITEVSNGVKFTYQGLGVGNFQIKMATLTYWNDPSTTPTITEVAWMRQFANASVPAYVFPGQDGATGETGNTVKGEDVDAAFFAQYLQSDLETNTTIVEYRPSLSLTFSTPNDEINDVACYSLYETVTIDPNFVLSRPGADPSLHLIDWVITDPEGLPVSLAQSQFPLNLSPSGLQLSVPLDKLGTYIVQATITDIECGTTFSVEDRIQTCNFVYVETTGTCGEFTLYNKSTLFDIDYRIQLIGGDEASFEGTLEANTTTTTGSALQFSVSDIGIHEIEIRWIDENDELQQMILIINNFCILWDCLAGYIIETLCKPENLCDPCPDSLRLNQMVLFNMAYSMKLNKEYEFNNFYSTLDESKLEEFTSINQLATKIKEFCDRLSCEGLCANVTQTSKTFTFGVSTGKACTTCGSSSGCGCSSKKSGGCGCGGNCGKC